MKSLNRVLLFILLCYILFSGYVFYFILNGASPFYGGRWRLVWSDEFNGSALDLTKWTPVDRFSNPNHEVQAYINENVSVQSGCLILTSKKEKRAGPDNDRPGQAVTRQYTSGWVKSRVQSAWTYGKFDCRAKFPTGRGLQSFAGLVSDEQWPPEISIQKMGNAPHDLLFLNFHGLDWRHPRFDSYQLSGPNYSEGFHIYSIEWEPGVIRWSVDGMLKYQIHRSVPDMPLIYSIRTWMGGTYAGEPDDGVLPQSFIVDWVRVYQRRR